MTQGYRFKPFSSKTLFLLLVGTATLVLQTGDNVASNAHEYTGTIEEVAKRSFKADRWMGNETRPGFYGTRLAHLWDGTPENKLTEMTPPKPDRVLLAYAPEISLTQTDAVKALRAFDDPPVEIADTIPTPLPRPSEKVLVESARGKKPGVPMALVGNLPKTAASIQAPAKSDEQKVQVASINPTAVLPEVTQPQVQQTPTVDPHNLPYTLQIPSVQTACFPAQLVSLIAQIEKRYNKKVVITSGYRPQSHARNGSLHVHCAAADIIVPGISGPQLAAFAKTLPGVGGVGQYCHPSMIHIDIGHHREWHYGCRAKSKKKTTSEDHDA